MAEGALISEEDAYTIAVMPQRRFVEVGLRGFWDVGTVRRFKTELKLMLPALPRHGCPLGEQVTLIDAAEFSVQSPLVVAALALMVPDPMFASRRIAVITSQALAKMQARRVAPKYRLFDDRHTALAWLCEAEPNQRLA